MSLSSKILKIFSLSIPSDSENRYRTGIGKEHLARGQPDNQAAMHTLANLLPLFILIVFIGIVAIIGYQVRGIHGMTMLYPTVVSLDFHVYIDS